MWKVKNLSRLLHKLHHLFAIKPEHFLRILLRNILSTEPDFVFVSLEEDFLWFRKNFNILE